jgi:hypothetical protein
LRLLEVPAAVVCGGCRPVDRRGDVRDGLAEADPRLFLQLALRAEEFAMFNNRWCAALGAVLVLMLVVPATMRADEPDARAVRRARDFLNGTQRGRFILGYMHFGTRYVGHKYKEMRAVVDGKGKTIPGQFALVYSYDWNKDGTTEAAFLCDRRGNVYRVQVLDSNGIINQPFAIGNATIKILGNVLIEAFKDQMTAEEKKQLRKAVDDADTKSLLELSLKLQQTFGK